MKLWRVFGFSGGHESGVGDRTAGEGGRDSSRDPGRDC